MKRRTIARMGLGALLLPFVGMGTGAQGTDGALRARLQAYLDTLHATGRFAGAQVGVALPGGESFAVAVGLADTATREPMTTSYLLLQGSVGKTYAAALAMQLVAEQRLALDEPIAKYLGQEPWFRRLPNAHGITIRMLMNHTSGLVRYEFQEQFTRDLSANPDRVWKPVDLITYVFDRAPPFPPGEGWEYSDTNYIVLGMIMERVLGGPYYTAVLQRVVEPLNLAATAPSDSRVIDGLAQGYAGPGNPFGGTDAMIVDGRFAINPQFEWTGGGFASTAEDLARWGKALYEGRAFPEGMLAMMLAGVPARLGQGTQYGLGVIIRETPEGMLYGHSSFFPGYQAEMLYVPAARVAVAFMVNSSARGALGPGRSPVRVALDVARMVAEGR